MYIYWVERKDDFGWTGDEDEWYSFIVIAKSESEARHSSPPEGVWIDEKDREDHVEVELIGQALAQYVNVPTPYILMES